VIRPNARIFLGMPGYGELTAGAARGFWRATRRPETHVRCQYNEGSLLAANFNHLWCAALNLAHSGERVDYFAMQHADVEPQDWWLDTLIEELEANDLDILGAAVPIKDKKGLTSLALARPDGDPWRIQCRITQTELKGLPSTFTSEDVGHPLLLNTGLWVCRFDEEWAKKVRFTINDRIAFDTNLGRYVAQCEPEDWYFSRLLHEIGLKVGATSKIRLQHRGSMAFESDRVWGDAFDSAYVEGSVLPVCDRDGFRFPRDVLGWLHYDEGKELWRLAHGKRVLEVGSYCGKSTICLAQSAAEVHSIDPHDGRATPEPRDTEEDLRANLWAYGVKHKVSIHKGCFSESDVWQVEAGQTPPFDLVFIDGAHDLDSVRNDIACARRVLSADGLLAFHDYRAKPGDFDGRWDPGVTEAIHELLAAGGELLSTHATLAVVRPPAAIPLEV
jgi:hypothetical protein